MKSSPQTISEPAELWDTHGEENQGKRAQRQQETQSSEDEADPWQANHKPVHGTKGKATDCTRKPGWQPAPLVCSTKGVPLAKRAKGCAREQECNDSNARPRAEGCGATTTDRRGKESQGTNKSILDNKLPPA